MHKPTKEGKYNLWRHRDTGKLCYIIGYVAKSNYNHDALNRAFHLSKFRLDEYIHNSSSVWKKENLLPGYSVYVYRGQEQSHTITGDKPTFSKGDKYSRELLTHSTTEAQPQGETNMSKSRHQEQYEYQMALTRVMVIDRTEKKIIMNETVLLDPGLNVSQWVIAKMKINPESIGEYAIYPEVLITIDTVE